MSRWVVGLALATGGCFDALRDRDCASNDDCFVDETCTVGHRCVTVASIGERDAGADALTVTVEAFGRDDPDRALAATINSSRPDDGCNHCVGADECRLAVPAGTSHRVCAHARGHRPCAVEATGLLRVELFLDACAEGEPCPEAPRDCDCRDLPECGG